MSMDLSKFRTSFFEETGEHLAAMEEGLLALEQRTEDLDLLNRIFRAAHSIKGNSGMFGFTAVGDFTHKVENILDALRNRQMVVTKPLIDLLLEATDALKCLIEAARTDAAPDDVVLGPLQERLKGCMTASIPDTSMPDAPPPSTSDHAVHRRYTIAWTPAPTLFQHGMDPLQIVRDLESLGALTTTAYGLDRLPPLHEMDPERCYLSWIFTLETDCHRKEVESVFDFVREGSVLTFTDSTESTPRNTAAGAGPGDKPSQWHPQADVPTDGEISRKLLGEILVEDGVVAPDQIVMAIEKQQQRKRLGDILVDEGIASPEQIAKALEKQKQIDKMVQTAETPSIRVDIEKIDRLINLVGELVITQSMLSDLGARFEMEQLSVLLERIAQLERNTREIQERVMSVRMLPIGTVFNRFPRLVRDLATKNGKKIQLVMSGEETEMDKTVIESIGDPLTHLVRNSADHGIETPEERATAGKPEQGTIKLKAYHEGGNICITVQDDGRGLNRDKILAKALKQGMISETDRPTDEQIWQLIFRPGFSTADQITDVSGRGVGMDVVKRNIEKGGGRVSIHTAAGQGSRFTLKLPLTLAIIDGLSVRVGRETFIVPLTTISKSIRPNREEMKSIVGRGKLVRVSDDYLPVVPLHEVFGIPDAISDPTLGILMILESEGEQVAVMVDELLGQQQVVIKSLEQNFQKVAGIAGATILGDGTVAFIVDVRGLVTLARQGATVEA
jgi:two-component system chemotaxis sensor kinase CheA